MSDDRTRWLKFAAFLCAYDSEDDVLREAAVTIRELADKVRKLEAQVAEIARDRLVMLKRAEEAEARVDILTGLNDICIKKRGVQARKIKELQAQVDRVKAIPEKAKERGASHYQQGWIAGWNGFYDELQAAIKGGE